jgi:hypothetical protein
LYPAQQLIQSFVKELDHIYPKSILLSGFHELLHLVDCTKRFGPLNFINCFQFEELNRKLLGIINGKDLIGEELIKLFSSLQALHSIFPSFQFTNSNIKEFVCSELACNSSNKKNKLDSCKESFFKLSFPLLFLRLDFINFINSKIRGFKGGNNINFFSKMTNTRNVSFSSVDSNLKRDDSCVFSNGKFGTILCFFSYNNEQFSLCKQIVPIKNTFFFPEVESIKSSLTFCHISSQLFIVSCREITKAALIRISDLETYVSTFSCSHLFN